MKPNTDAFREYLGKLVRQTRIDFCIETGHDQKPEHIAIWDQLSDWDKEVNMRIGDELYDNIERLILRWQAEGVIS